jgi:hypothetical protein
METIVKYAPKIVLIAGVWNLVNGILHDIFVLRSDHGKQYDRTLLRLLMDGHILITSGIVLLLCTNGVRLHQPYPVYIAITICCSMIVYCIMIFPFLKSLGTIGINLLTLLILIVAILSI